MENIDFFDKGKFNSRLVHKVHISMKFFILLLWDRFPAFLCHDVLNTFFLCDTIVFGLIEEIPKSEDETKSRCFSLKKENQKSNYKNRTEKQAILSFNSLASG